MLIPTTGIKAATLRYSAYYTLLRIMKNVVHTTNQKYRRGVFEICIDLMYGGKKVKRGIKKGLAFC